MQCSKFGLFFPSACRVVSRSSLYQSLLLINCPAVQRDWIVVKLVSLERRPFFSAFVISRNPFDKIKEWSTLEISLKPKENLSHHSHIHLNDYHLIMILSSNVISSVKLLSKNKLEWFLILFPLYIYIYFVLIFYRNNYSKY